MVNRITLENVLPDAFAEQRDSRQIGASHIWLEEVTLQKPLSYLIFAESGTGKSSLCSYIYGSRHDYSGSIFFDGDDIRGFDPEKWSALRQGSLAYLPQQMSLFPELTALENVMIKNRLTDIYTEADVRRMFERLEVDHRADALAGRLSLGQQQRVAVVRALCQPFDFLLLDEPVSHLDARTNALVAAMVTEHADRSRASIVATSVGNHLAIDSCKILRL